MVTLNGVKMSKGKKMWDSDTKTCDIAIGSGRKDATAQILDIIGEKMPVAPQSEGACYCVKKTPGPKTAFHANHPSTLTEHATA